MLLLTLFAVVAAGLAAVGIYGVVAFLVAQGTREMGIRIALGATPRGIVMLTMRQGFLVALAGVGLGLAGAFIVTRFLSSLLFGIDATDAATFISIAAGLGAVALLASYVPARRAARIDPVASLRAN